jgi:hypothetical protein
MVLGLLHLFIRMELGILAMTTPTETRTAMTPATLMSINGTTSMMDGTLLSHSILEKRLNGTLHLLKKTEMGILPMITPTETAIRMILQTPRFTNGIIRLIIGTRLGLIVLRSQLLLQLKLFLLAQLKKLHREALTAIILEKTHLGPLHLSTRMELGIQAMTIPTETRIAMTPVTQRYTSGIILTMPSMFQSLFILV